MTERLKEKIDRLKKRRPAYKELLDFYEKVVTEQVGIKPRLVVPSVETEGDFKNLQTREGFPLISKEDFTLDIPSSVMVFETLCDISKDATDKMRENIQKIERAIREGTLDLEKLLKRHYDESCMDEIIEDLELDGSILRFLIHMSIKPSIDANVSQLKDQADLKNWLRGYCPICGSLPKISELRGEGQRYLICSFCGFKWQGERLSCPFCENRDHETLHYFYAEGQEAYRLDVCEKCRQYIKTIDTRKLDYEPELNLEDITTMHLDLLASEKGFKRSAPSPWYP